jgi:hypothetical protein
MTELALRGSRYVNGVHAVVWAAPSFQALYDRHLPDWRRDHLSFRYAVGIPGAEIWAVRIEAKRALVELVNHETNAGFDRDVLTVGFTRRAALYKRGTLVFHDLDRLKTIVRQVAPFSDRVRRQGPSAGPGRQGRDPADPRGARRAQGRRRGRLPQQLRHGFSETRLSRRRRLAQYPAAASGGIGDERDEGGDNGVPSLSVLDGWWLEGHVEGVTGWLIGERIDACLEPAPGMDACHVAALYDKLANQVLPCFYEDRECFIGIMLHCIALNGAFFKHASHDGPVSAQRLPAGGALRPRVAIPFFSSLRRHGYVILDRFIRGLGENPFPHQVASCPIGPPSDDRPGGRVIDSGQCCELIEGGGVEVDQSAFVRTVPWRPVQTLDRNIGRPLHLGRKRRSGPG